MNGGVPTATTMKNAAEEEDYFDYSPNIDNDDKNNSGLGGTEDDQGIITRILKLTCRCFDSISGVDIIIPAGGDAAGGDNTTLFGGKSVMSGGMGATIMETVNDTTATIANTMMTKKSSQQHSKAPTFSDPITEKRSTKR